MNREKLIDLVLTQIQNDLEGGDVTCVVELLAPLSDEHLMGYLPEDVQEQCDVEQDS